jgi:hypothetical protein
MSEMEKPDIPPAFILVAIVLQVGVCVLIHLAIQRRLSRPAHISVPGAA